VLVVAAVALVIALWAMGEEETPEPSPVAAQSASPQEALPSSPPRASERPPPAVLPAPAAGSTSRDVLAAALHEEMVPLVSSAVVEAIDQDRPWVCAGEPMGLAARLGGGIEPGAVHRWIWLTKEGSAELHPGLALQWEAPPVAGRYAVRFQVCKDLGGRRVGVLAERIVEVDVRACGPGERQEFEPLRLTVTQRRQGAFLFRAVSPGSERIETYAWDFGDGTTVTTSGPEAEHSYVIQDLGPNETRSFTVKLSARSSRGMLLTATAFVLTRGVPPNDEPTPVELEISRWSAQPDGGWRSDLVVRDVSTGITWDRVERVTRYWDGGVDIDTRKWSEVVRVEEELERGGFRGYVLVSPSEASPGIKQILDFLYGTDLMGQEVMVSWSPYKSEAPPTPPSAEEPPRK
jgi:PKD domain